MAHSQGQGQGEVEGDAEGEAQDQGEGERAFQPACRVFVLSLTPRVCFCRLRIRCPSGSITHRMSHNPVTPGLYDILDRVGVVAMDESRILGTDPISIMNMGLCSRRTC